jgi:hypothetical protein
MTAVEKLMKRGWSEPRETQRERTSLETESGNVLEYIELLFTSRPVTDEAHKLGKIGAVVKLSPELADDLPSEQFAQQEAAQSMLEAIDRAEVAA